MYDAQLYNPAAYYETVEQIRELPNTGAAFDDEAALLEELNRGPRAGHHMYRVFEIPKVSGKPEAGTRRITAPNQELMRYQYMLLTLLLRAAPVGSSAAHAYYRGRSIRSMAEPHVRKRWVIRLDLKDFFPSISPRMVSKAMRQRGIRPELFPLVDKFCFLDGGLPMGAPTSPLLSNIVAGHALDRRFLGLCDSWHMTNPTAECFRIEPIAYTRYADDLCFSSDYRQLPKIIPTLKWIIKDAGFEINLEKLKVLGWRNRQTVCGVSLNAHLGKPRQWRKTLRAILHNAVRDMTSGVCAPGYMIMPYSDDPIPVPLAALEGLVGHIEFLNPQQARFHRDHLNQIKEYCTHVPNTQEEHPAGRGDCGRGSDPFGSDDPEEDGQRVGHDPEPPIDD